MCFNKAFHMNNVKECEQHWDELKLQPNMQHKKPKSKEGKAKGTSIRFFIHELLS